VVSGADAHLRVPDAPKKPFSRKRSLVRSMVVLLAGGVVWLIFATANSTYAGTGVTKALPHEKAATARASACWRSGPISSQGFGYWWTCRAVVRVADGRVVNTTVTHSILAPSDIGHQVEFREACFGDNNTRCSYGRPTALFWGILVRISRIVQDAVAVAFGFLIVVYLLGAILGKERANRIIGHRAKRS
jgi:hypothetical protein